MRFAYTSDFQDFQRAVRTCIRSTPRRRFTFHFQSWIMATIGVTSVIALSLSHSSYDRQLPALAFALACGLIAGGIVMPLLRPWMIRRAYKAQSGGIKNQIPLYLEVDCDTLVSGIEGQSEARFQRAGIRSTAEDDQILLLFVTQRKYLYLPKNRLPKEAIDAVHEWLAGGAKSC